MDIVFDAVLLRQLRAIDELHAVTTGHCYRVSKSVGFVECIPMIRCMDMVTVTPSAIANQGYKVWIHSAHVLFFLPIVLISERTRPHPLRLLSSIGIIPVLVIYNFIDRFLYVVGEQNQFMLSWIYCLP